MLFLHVYRIIRNVSLCSIFSYIWELLSNVSFKVKFNLTPFSVTINSVCKRVWKPLILIVCCCNYCPWSWGHTEIKRPAYFAFKSIPQRLNQFDFWNLCLAVKLIKFCWYQGCIQWVQNLGVMSCSYSGGYYTEFWCFRIHDLKRKKKQTTIFKGYEKMCGAGQQMSSKPVD